MKERREKNGSIHEFKYRSYTLQIEKRKLTRSNMRTKIKECSFKANSKQNISERDKKNGCQPTEISYLSTTKEVARPDAKDVRT